METPSIPQKSRILVFNIGGTKFHTSFGTIESNSSTKLSEGAFLSSHYDEQLGEYFFDRDPEIFRCVLNYLRSGKLHLPANTCGPVIKDELEYWGVQEASIEACCWMEYNRWTTTVQALEQLEKDRKQHAHVHVNDATSRLANAKLQTWMFLTSHNSSIGAKIYGWVSLFFVLLAIFSFCAATHQTFRVPVMRSPANQTHSSSGNTSAATTEVPPDDVTVDLDRDTEQHPLLFYIDIICLSFFTIEYVLRLICAPRKLKFFLSPLSIIDLLAILPDYIEFIVYAINPEAAEEGTFMKFMPLLRLMRAFRIFRLIRHVPGLWIMFYTLRASFKDLSLMLVFLLVGMLLFSSLIYFADDQRVFTSIPHGFWWAVITMTTVGYGDMYPTTPLGYVVGSLTAICGVLLIGFTIPALVNNFSLYYQHVEFAIQREKLLMEGTKHGVGKTRGSSQTSPPQHYGDSFALQENIPLNSLVIKDSKDDEV